MRDCLSGTLKNNVYMNGKKILMLLFAFAACSAAVPTVSAQESGWWIGGRVGYWHDKVEGVTSSGFALAPNGFFCI